MPVSGVGDNSVDVSVVYNVCTGGDGVAMIHGGSSLNDNPIVESPLPDIHRDHLVAVWAHGDRPDCGQR